MASHRVVIEQLYEDPNPSVQVKQMSEPQAAKVTTAKPKEVSKPSTSKKTNNKSRSTSIITKNSDVESHKSLESVSKERRHKSSGTASCYASRSGLTSSEDKMTSKTALALYGTKLMPYEIKEIAQYNTVYFLGLTANKIASSDTDQQKMFDDDESFYRVVPKDHIAFRFEVVEKPNLGKGTFGQVIKAYDRKEGRFVALKLVRNERIYLKQSREELRILQVLRKQDPHGVYNVVHMFEFFMFRNHMVICFELLGMNLYQVLKRNNYRGLSMGRIQPIAKAVIKCLELLSKNRIIHCDIKPENIMLRKDGDMTSVKVGDFGSSCYEQQQIYHYIQSRYYRAPEVILGIRYGPAIDMWSLGCVMAELCVGQPIFMGSDEDDQLAAIEEIIGEVPKSLLNKAKNQHRNPRKRSRGPPGSKPLERVISGDDFFKDAMKKILELDPAVRPTPNEIQIHPWFKPAQHRPSTRSTPSTQPTHDKQSTSSVSTVDETPDTTTKKALKKTMKRISKTGKPEAKVDS